TLQPTWINNPALNWAGAISNGAPVRGFDKVAYRSYQAADGNWYLGQRNPAQTGTIQPVVGPLIGANGVTFTYYDSGGTLIAGALFSGTQEQRVAENVRRVQASFGVAEEGVYDIIRGWSDPTTKQKYANLYPYPAVAPSRDTVQFGKKTAKSMTGSYSGEM